MTNMSDEPCILVVGSDQVYVSTALDALRHNGWNAVGTWDPWEAVMLVSRRSFSLIAQDRDMDSLGALGFLDIVAEDPVLKDVPTVFFTKNIKPDELMTGIRNLLQIPLPPAEPSRGDTRFVRRRRPSTIPA